MKKNNTSAADREIAELKKQIEWLELNNAMLTDDPAKQSQALAGIAQLKDERDIALAGLHAFRTSTAALLDELTEWSARMGGWESPVWEEVETLRRKLKAQR